MFDVIAFDADDTLWHNESLFTVTQDQFRQLLARYNSAAWTGKELFETEIRNLDYFGYGIKGFTLSMIETAIQLTDGQVTGRDIQHIIDYGKAMLRTPIQLLDHVADVIVELAQTNTLMLITKGDLFDQEAKIAQSGLAEHFTHIEVVSHKTPEAYAAILRKHRIAPARFLMVGNSPKSDILPVIALGASAIHIPYHTTWAHEAVADASAAQHGYSELAHIGLLPAAISALHAQRGAQ